MSIRNDIKSLNDTLINNTLAQMAATWANCREAEIGDHGDIWICGPQRGHWLGSDDLEEFMIWVSRQDLDEWQDRCNPEWAAKKAGKG